MDEESIIRKIKSLFHYIFVSIIIVGFVALLIPSLIYINKETEIESLYKKTKKGILIEDVYLAHAEVVGNIWEPMDGFTFKIYAKSGD